jgi:hypothetical protein
VASSPDAGGSAGDVLDTRHVYRHHRLRGKGSSGVIKGRPHATGTFAFTVEVLDKKSKTKPHTQNTGTRVLSITVT